MNLMPSCIQNVHKYTSKYFIIIFLYILNALNIFALLNLYPFANIICK